MSRYLQHVTLATGHTRRSPRSEVYPETIELLTPLIRRALDTGEHVPVPRTPGYSFTAAAEGQCAMITLWAVVPETAELQRAPVLTSAIALRSRCGAAVWRMMHDREDLRYSTDPERQPPTPWLADRLDVGAALNPDAAEWTGDWSRSVAWTWIEINGGRDDDRRAAARDT